MTDEIRRHEYTFLRRVREGSAFCVVCEQEITAAQWVRDEPCQGPRKEKR